MILGAQNYSWGNHHPPKEERFTGWGIDEKGAGIEGVHWALQDASQGN